MPENIRIDSGDLKDLRTAIGKVYDRVIALGVSGMVDGELISPATEKLKAALGGRNFLIGDEFNIRLAAVGRSVETQRAWLEKLFLTMDTEIYNMITKLADAEKDNTLSATEFLNGLSGTRAVLGGAAPVPPVPAPAPAKP